MVGRMGLNGELLGGRSCSPGESRHKRSGSDRPPNPASCWLDALLHPKFQPCLKQTFGYIVLAHELHQQPMHLPCFVQVILDHIVKLLGIGCQIVELRHSWVRAVQQAPMSCSDGCHRRVFEITEEVVY